MGQTGYPIVDAGMRELWETGFMHNRVRMIVGSFLVKNLLIDWRVGESWFWDCLFDADAANNVAGWQWIAGCGADAAPYFRVFNPITQGIKFDPEGKYTKRFVPELKSLPNKYLFSPWEAPEYILKESGVILGKTYPKPIVDVKQSRLLALDAFSSLKKKN
jgi:Deoxyribodipyrimidine photolyase